MVRVRNPTFYGTWCASCWNWHVRGILDVARRLALEVVGAMALVKGRSVGACVGRDVGAGVGNMSMVWDPRLRRDTRRNGRGRRHARPSRRAPIGREEHRVDPVRSAVAPHRLDVAARLLPVKPCPLAASTTNEEEGRERRVVSNPQLGDARHRKSSRNGIAKEAEKGCESDNRGVDETRRPACGGGLGADAGRANETAGDGGPTHRARERHDVVVVVRRERVAGAIVLDRAVVVQLAEAQRMWRLLLSCEGRHSVRRDDTSLLLRSARLVEAEREDLHRLARVVLVGPDLGVGAGGRTVGWWIGGLMDWWIDGLID